jgi:hypothetical protein
MSKITLRQNPNLEQIELERHLRFKNLSPTEKMKELCHLIELTIQLGGEKSIKKSTAKITFKKFNGYL